MKKDKINEKLLHIIREKVPQGTTVASVLMDILSMSKEAVYRRLRGEVPFTFDEAAVIATHMGISLDNIVGSDIVNIVPFQLKQVEYSNPKEFDYVQLEHFISFLHATRGDSFRELGASYNLFPHVLYTGCDYLSKYYIFRWMYQSNGIKGIKSIEDIEITPRLADIQKRYMEESMYINNTFYIWDSLVFQYLVNEIKFFSSIRYITKEDTLAMREDLLKFVSRLERLAAKGQFETGKKIQFYLSPINLDTTYSYLQTQDYSISQIKVFSLNTIASFDINTFDKLKSWIQSLRRLSTLISESNEIQRVQFFKKQREIINTIGDEIYI